MQERSVCRSSELERSHCPFFARFDEGPEVYCSLNTYWYLNGEEESRLHTFNETDELKRRATQSTRRKQLPAFSKHGLLSAGKTKVDLTECLS